RGLCPRAGRQLLAFGAGALCGAAGGGEALRSHLVRSRNAGAGGACDGSSAAPHGRVTPLRRAVGDVREPLLPAVDWVGKASTLAVSRASRRGCAAAPRGRAPMTYEFRHLFPPIRAGNLALKNRISSSAHA